MEDLAVTEPDRLRERKRQAVREEVLTRAWDLFVVRGFEATTVEEIAAAAGMSARSFFRYFAAKDDLLRERLFESGEAIAAALAARPAGEPAWPALRAAFETMLRRQRERPDRVRALTVMLREPALRAITEERRRRWEDLLSPLVAARLGPATVAGAGDPRARAVTAAALACLDVAHDVWLVADDAELADLLDAAMSAVHPLRSAAVGGG